VRLLSAPPSPATPLVCGALRRAGSLRCAPLRMSCVVKVLRPQGGLCARWQRSPPSRFGRPPLRADLPLRSLGFAASARPPDLLGKCAPLCSVRSHSGGGVALLGFASLRSYHSGGGVALLGSASLRSYHSGGGVALLGSASLRSYPRAAPTPSSWSLSLRSAAQIQGVVAAPSLRSASLHTMAVKLTILLLIDFRALFAIELSK
jgi:hypothetical protein